jgi:hypothetical protein
MERHELNRSAVLENIQKIQHAIKSAEADEEREKSRLVKQLDSAIEKKTKQLQDYLGAAKSKTEIEDRWLFEIRGILREVLKQYSILLSHFVSYYIERICLLRITFALVTNQHLRLYIKALDTTVDLSERDLRNSANISSRLKLLSYFQPIFRDKTGWSATDLISFIDILLKSDDAVNLQQKAAMISLKRLKQILENPTDPKLKRRLDDLHGFRDFLRATKRELKLEKDLIHSELIQSKDRIIAIKDSNAQLRKRYIDLLNSLVNKDDNDAIRREWDLLIEMSQPARSDWQEALLKYKKAIREFHSIKDQWDHEIAIARANKLWVDLSELKQQMQNAYERMKLAEAVQQKQFIAYGEMQSYLNPRFEKLKQLKSRLQILRGGKQILRSPGWSELNEIFQPVSYIGATIDFTGR